MDGQIDRQINIQMDIYIKIYRWMDRQIKLYRLNNPCLYSKYVLMKRIDPSLSPPLTYQHPHPPRLPSAFSPPPQPGAINPLYTLSLVFSWTCNLRRPPPPPDPLGLGYFRLSTLLKDSGAIRFSQHPFLFIQGQFNFLI